MQALVGDRGDVIVEIVPATLFRNGVWIAIASSGLEAMNALIRNPTLAILRAVSWFASSHSSVASHPSWNTARSSALSVLASAYCARSADVRTGLNPADSSVRRDGTPRPGSRPGHPASGRR